MGEVFRTIGELAERCGHYCWLEDRIFALTGSRASQVTANVEAPAEAEIRVFLSEMSAWHASLAAQWRHRLPVRAAVDAGALVVAPPGPAAEALALLQAEPDLSVLLDGLVVQILPRLLDTYRRHFREAAPVREGPLLPVLEVAVLRAGQELAGGQAVLRRTVGPAEAVAPHSPLQGLFSAQMGIFPGARAS